MFGGVDLPVLPASCRGSRKPETVLPAWAAAWSVAGSWYRRWSVFSEPSWVSALSDTGWAAVAEVSGDTEWVVAAGVAWDSPWCSSASPGVDGTPAVLEVPALDSATLAAPPRSAPPRYPGSWSPGSGHASPHPRGWKCSPLPRVPRSLASRDAPTKAGLSAEGDGTYRAPHLRVLLAVWNFNGFLRTTLADFFN